MVSRTALSPALGFYAASAHYANLTNGAAGQSVALGIQLAQRGLPQVLRGTTADFDIDGDADGQDFMIWQQNLGASGNRKIGDASGNGTVGSEDLDTLKAAYGFNHLTATFGANYFAPQSQGIDNSNVLLGPALPGLTQGKLIDKTYAMGPGGATDNAGTGALRASWSSCSRRLRARPTRPAIATCRTSSIWKWRSTTAIPQA